jgi:hypothetical protein
MSRHQALADRKNRRAMEPKKAIRWDDRKMADLSKHKPRSCQYVMGEDRYMCGQPIHRGPYCADHWSLTHRKSSGDAA